MIYVILILIVLGAFEFKVYANHRYEEDLMITVAIWGVAMFLTFMKIFGG